MSTRCQKDRQTARQTDRVTERQTELQNRRAAKEPVPVPNKSAEKCFI